MWSTLGGIIDAIPVAGHIKGAVHYATGDYESGKNSMVSSSRSTCVTAGSLGGFCVGGPAGAIAGGMGAGAAMDGA
jgi:hypothetical protein